MSRSIALALILALVSCKKDPLAEHKATAEAKTVALKALAAKELPTLQSDTLAFDGALHESGMVDGDTAVYPLEALANPGVDSPAALFPSEHTTKNAIAWVSAGKLPQYTAEIAVKEALDSLERLNKVLVVKSIEWVKPVVEGDKFAPGSYRGEAHLFDLAGKYYGGVRFSAVSSTSVEITKGVTKDGQEKWRNDKAAVANDLHLRAWKALGDALVARAPGAKLLPR